MFLLVAYIAIFVLQIVLLVLSVRKKQKKLWRRLFVSVVIPLLTAVGLYFYYDNLPGGIFGGLTYLGEVLFSLGAAVVYGVLLLISAFCYLVSPQE